MELDDLAKRIIVAIPTLNEEKSIKDCLASLMDDSPALQNTVFVVADGGSSDATKEIVTAKLESCPNLRLLDNPDRLQSAAVNRVADLGVEMGCDILVRCDAHSLYPKGFILDVAQTLITRGDTSVVVPIDSVGRTCFAKGAAWVVDTPFGSGGSAHRGGKKSGYVNHGHHAGFALDWFHKLGGYDKTFSHNEDGELDYRITNSGGKIWLASDIRVTYFMRNSFGKLCRQYFNYGKGRARNVSKHSSVPHLRQLLPVANLIFLVACLALALLVTPMFLLGIAFYLLTLSAISFLIAVKKSSLCGLSAGLALIAIHLMWASGFVIQYIKGRLA